MPKIGEPVPRRALPRAGRRGRAGRRRAPAFDRVREIEREEGRTFVHPFEGPLTALGTATLGLELMEQAPGPRRGDRARSAAAGCARAWRPRSSWSRPRACVFGVEPAGADSHAPQLRRGHAAVDRRRAHDRGQPGRAPRRALQLRRCAAGTWTSWCWWTTTRCAAPCCCCSRRPSWRSSRRARPRPPRCAGRCASGSPGKRVGLVVCGANIDPATFATHLAAAG